MQRPGHSTLATHLTYIGKATHANCVHVYVSILAEHSGANLTFSLKGEAETFITAAEHGFARQKRGFTHTPLSEKLRNAFKISIDAQIRDKYEWWLLQSPDRNFDHVFYPLLGGVLLPVEPLLVAIKGITQEQRAAGNRTAFAVPLELREKLEQAGPGKKEAFAACDYSLVGLGSHGYYHPPTLEDIQLLESTPVQRARMQVLLKWEGGRDLWLSADSTSAYLRSGSNARAQEEAEKRQNLRAIQEPVAKHILATSAQTRAYHWTPRADSEGDLHFRPWRINAKGEMIPVHPLQDPVPIVGAPGCFLQYPRDSEPASTASHPGGHPPLVVGGMRT